MRTRLLALIAVTATALGTALVALPLSSSQALEPPAWTLCTSPSQTSCIESAKRGGVDVVPGPTATPNRDYPEVRAVGSDLIDFSAIHDINGNGTNTDYNTDPTKVYVLVLRTGSFRPREMDAIAKNGDFSISGGPGAWKATVQFQPTAIHHTSPGGTPCSFDGGCGDDTTVADSEFPVIATGAIDDLAASGLSTREIYARTGMFTTTNAQNSYTFYDIDTGALQIRMANPHLQADGVTPVTDGNYNAFLPNAYLIYVMGVPDPSALTTSSFLVSKSVGGTTTSAPYSITPDSDGVRINFANISFSRPVYKVRIKATAPGAARLYKVIKTGAHTARTKFSAPIANGRARIDKYQARCHKAGRAWHYKSGKGSPLTVGTLPRGRVYCQVRAHNLKGWGHFSLPLHS